MQQPQLYQFVYADCLRHGGIRLDDLSADLQALIIKAESALKMLRRSDAQTREQLLFTVAGADAVICDSICKQYPEKTATWQPALPEIEGNTDLDKTLLMALRAKALRLKRGNGKRKN